MPDKMSFPPSLAITIKPTSFSSVIFKKAYEWIAFPISKFSSYHKTTFSLFQGTRAFLASFSVETPELLGDSGHHPVWPAPH